MICELKKNIISTFQVVTVMSTYDGLWLDSFTLKPFSLPNITQDGFSCEFEELGLNW